MTRQIKPYPGICRTPANDLNDPNETSGFIAQLPPVRPWADFGRVLPSRPVPKVKGSGS
jgi:hypothetical protein